ncbi:F-box-like domain-containing protein [Microdochium nivale]|nr:F-box-like domain-containing protein [Microdochium nivale]
MRKPDSSDDSDLAELVDTTEALPLKSRRTARSRRKQDRRVARAKEQAFKLLNLPYELVLDIFSLLRPSDVFRLLRVDKTFHAFITDEHNLPRITTAIAGWRYSCLLQSYRLPVLLENVDPFLHDELKSVERGELLGIHRKPYYQHIPAPDPAVVCTCLACMLQWNVLCIAVDLAHWQDHLDQGTPLPTMKRGEEMPAWNRELLARNAGVVGKALRSPLWHASILEAHLQSTVRAVARDAANKGNKRRRFEMSDEDAKSGSDVFLSRIGPPSFELPFRRDNYYMLGAYVPNRSWNKVYNEWRYLPEDQHKRDLVWVYRRAEDRVNKEQRNREQRVDKGELSCLADIEMVAGEENAPGSSVGANRHRQQTPAPT